ncbi:MAG: (d)CMP kinase [Anaerolineae bacterium]|nr:(d)CMP kinase [Anaerolineae bacterium]
MSKQPNIIAIDGPAASGKSTLGERLAKHFGYLYFDTGVMYRAVTWAVLHSSCDVRDEIAVTKIAENTQIEVLPPSAACRKYDVLIDGRDITDEIRSPEVEAMVSVVSAYPGVRRAMSLQQRRIGLRGNVVMVGRDIGTVVLPEAPLKVYLEASVEVRAKRRLLEVKQRDPQMSYEEVLQALMRRDEIDSTRSVAPLRPADDAHIIHTDNLTIEEVVRKVIDLSRGV